MNCLRTLKLIDLYPRLGKRNFFVHSHHRDIFWCRSPCESSIEFRFTIAAQHKDIGLSRRELFSAVKIQFSQPTSVNSVSPSFLQQNRFKKKSAKTVEDEDQDEEDDVEETVEDTTGDVREWTEKIIQVNSLRLDGLLKTALSTSRNKIDESFYDGKIRVNGEKIAKKSYMLSTSDEVDVITGPDSKNNDFLDVARIIIDDVGSQQNQKNKMSVKVRIWKKLAIENYKGANKFSLVAA